METSENTVARAGDKQYKTPSSLAQFAAPPSSTVFKNETESSRVERGRSSLGTKPHVDANSHVKTGIFVSGCIGLIIFR
jgi:hypothetical protein